MPKTTIHKNRQTLFAEREIRVSGERQVSPPTMDFVPTQETH
jgi:hypothetical protein